MRLATLERLQLPNISVRIMADALRSVGISPARALAEAGISEDRFADDQGTVSGAQELAFQRAFVALTPDDHDLWLATGRRYHVLAYGNLGVAMMTARTLDEMIATTVKLGDFYYSLVRFTPVVGDDGLVGVEMDTTEIPEPLIVFSTLRDMTAVVRSNGDAWGATFPFTRFDVALPEKFRPVVERHVSVPLVFGAARTRWFWATDLQDRPLSMSNDFLHSATLRQLETMVAASRPHDDLADQIARLMIDRGLRFSLHEAAAELKLSPRTLQRRLAERGIRFRQFMTIVRQRMAMRLLLATDLAVEAIAWRVGYADASAFNHAFRKEVGLSPRAFRKANGGGSGGVEDKLEPGTVG